jgi:hypothetical protein
MKTWKTAKTIIKNLVQNSFDEDWLKLLSDPQDAKILASLELIKSELWQECYVTLDVKSLSKADLDQIRSAAQAQLMLASED